MNDNTPDVRKPANDMAEYEIHPFSPFIPADARVLIMGTFPPPAARHSMNFYYPNRTNDFWRIMGIIFFNDPTALMAPNGKDFNLDAIKRLLEEKGIAMSDTGYRIHRLRGNASDKFLEIVDPVDLQSLLTRMSGLKAIITTGEKAADVVARLTDTLPPKMGQFTEIDSNIRHWRMPSTSRAYPLAISKKADFYSLPFREAGLID